MSETLDCLILEVGTDSLSQMSVNHCQTMLHNVPEDENLYNLSQMSVNHCQTMLHNVPEDENLNCTAAKT